MKVSRPLALSLLLLLGSSPAAHRAQAFEIERLSHRPDRIRLSSDEPLLVRFDRSLDASTVGTDAITLTRQDPQGVRRIPGHVELEATVVPMDTLRFVPESEGLRFGRRHRIAFAQRLRGSDGSSLENVDHTRLRFVINKPANLSEVPLALGTALLGYDPLDPEGTDLDDAIQIPGISVTQAWKRTVGRPDVLVAILDTGFESYGSPGLRDAIFLNRGELPRPLGAADYDANRDGRFNARDYHGDARVGDANGDGFLDAGDLITAFENGEDDDGNGLIDDISGYDFFREAPRALGVHDFLEGTHGEGRALEVAGAAGADTGEIVGACPDCTVVPIRVSDTILVEGNVFARAMRYAAGLGADIALAAVGGINNASEARRAVDEGWDAGLFLVAASGDELAFHHNFPATLARVYQVKSVFPLPGRFDLGDLPFDLPLGFAHYVETLCTNHGAHLDATVSSSNCSSESAGNLAGGAGLVLARALDLGIELSPGELRQILNGSADDIADSCIVLTDGGCQEGWDSHFGYGRTNIRKAVELLGDPEQAIGARIPPEVDIRSPEWFVTIDPEVTPTLDVVARIRARGRDLSYSSRQPRASNRSIRNSGSSRGVI